MIYIEVQGDATEFLIDSIFAKLEIKVFLQ
jgi:hypothetical protein